MLNTGMAEVKVCPGCGTSFTLQELIASPDLHPAGMQFIDAALKRNVYYFDHADGKCGSTFVVPVEVFRSLITETFPDTILTGTEQCEHHCVDLADLAVCSAPCHYAPFRRFLLSMLERSSAAPGGTGIRVAVIPT